MPATTLQRHDSGVVVTRRARQSWFSGFIGACVVAAQLLVAMTSSASGSAATDPEFLAEIQPLTAGQRDAMTPTVWRRGCPVRLVDLRSVTVSHWTFDGDVTTGRLVVHEDAAQDVVQIMAGLFALHFPIRRIVPIQRYGGSDFESIEADNTSAFNCRFIDGTRRWSQHAYGRAIDINPLENPYVSRGHTSHRASQKFLNRNVVRPGMIVNGSKALAVIEASGWRWGGRWHRPKPKDYQHISASGD